MFMISLSMYYLINADNVYIFWDPFFPKKIILQKGTTQE